MLEHKDLNENEGKKGGSKLKTLLLLLFIFLFAGSTILGSLFWMEREQLHLAYMLKIAELEEIIKIKDSMGNQLIEMEQQLADMQKEQKALSEIIIGLEEEQQELIATIKHLRQKLFNASPDEIRRLKNEIKQLHEKTEFYEGKIAQLAEENRGYINEKEAIDREKDILQKENISLTSAVKKASNPYFGPVYIETGFVRKDEFKVHTKARRVEIVKISFDLIENPIVNSKVNLLAMIKIVSPDGSILIQEKEITRMTDKSDIYSIKYPFIYTGRAQKIEIDFINPFPFQKGAYKVQLYFDGTIKQTKEFVLN